MLKECILQFQFISNAVLSLILMGNTNESEDSLTKGEGYRILRVAQNSPFQGKVEEFFDFIVEVTALQPQKSAAEILDKLAPPTSSNVKEQKSVVQLLKEGAGKQISVKIVSSKFRKIRTVEVNLDNEVSQNNTIGGLSFRKQRFDEVFDTYCPISEVQNNSPVKKAGIKEGQFLIGCLQYPYKTIDAFMEGLYERFFDKEIKKKSVHIAVYDLVTDHLSIKQVHLMRGWGGKGLLGCEFLQGHLYKFPHDLEAQSKEMRIKEKQRKQVEKIKNELEECDGSSKVLVQSLKSQKNKKMNHLRNIRKLLNIQPPNLQKSVEKRQLRQKMSENESEVSHMRVQADKLQQKRIEQLEGRVQALQQTLYSVKQYITKMQIPEQNDNQ